MDEVQRVFTLLVEVLSDSAPERLRAPIEIAEIYQSILPYRQFRSRLPFDTNQDYEMAVLRLLAGEGGVASVDPPEVQQALADEARAVHPNPGAFREYAAARVFLNSTAVDAIVSSHDAYAPPQPAPAPAEPEPERTLEQPAVPFAPPDIANAATLPFTPVDPEEPQPAPSQRDVDAHTTFDELSRAEDTVPTSCPSCTRLLPRRGALRFCPFCGMDVTTPSCRFCGTDLEPDWAFCIACGRQKSTDS